MDVEYWSKETLFMIAAIATILSGFIMPLFKVIFYRFNFLNKFSQRKAEYEQVKELIYLIEKAKDDGRKPHSFLIEKGYAVISGTGRFNSDEIIYCLNMDTPSQALNYFSSGFDYLKYSKTSKSFGYRKFADSSIKRMFIRVLCFLVYLLFAMIAFYIIFSATEYYAKSRYEAAIFLTIFSVILAVSAIIFASFGINVRMAEKFMKLQDEMFKESDSLSTITNKSETEESEVEEADPGNQES